MLRKKRFSYIDVAMITVLAHLLRVAVEALT